MTAARRLRVVRDGEAAEGEVTPAPDHRARPAADVGDTLLVACLFMLNLIPVVGEVAGAGRWSSAIVGFAAGASLLTGRELWSQLRPRLWPRAGARSAP
jgi:hypothetical protein